jgi:uncharacterized membrane protein
MNEDRDLLLERILRPNPPLDPRALVAILGLVAAVNFVLAANFIQRGAWPILPFLGAGVALLAWAFHRSLAAARYEEHVTLTASSLKIARKPGTKQDIVLNPYWVRVEMNQENQLMLWSHGKSVRLGAFLAPAEKTSFAQALRSALWCAKNPC